MALVALGVPIPVPPRADEFAPLWGMEKRTWGARDAEAVVHLRRPAIYAYVSLYPKQNRSVETYGNSLRRACILRAPHNIQEGKGTCFDP